jgi:hypothetical protein
VVHFVEQVKLAAFDVLEKLVVLFLNMAVHQLKCQSLGKKGSQLHLLSLIVDDFRLQFRACGVLELSSYARIAQSSGQSFAKSLSGVVDELNSDVHHD